MTIHTTSAWFKGYSHTKCQDKTYVCTGKLFLHNHREDDSEGSSDYGLAIVCDGAGSKTHSDAGAYIAAKSVAEYFTSYYEWKSFDNFNLEEIKADLIAYILKNIYDNMSFDQLISDYSCTLLFLLFIEKSRRYVYGHIGDGGIVGLEGDSLRIISGPENGEYKNQTFFITDPDANDHFRFGSGRIESDASAFLLCTDGIADSLFKQSKTTEIISPVCQTLCQWLMNARTEADIARVRKAYSDNLKKYFSTKSKDDLSLAVMTIC